MACGLDSLGLEIHIFAIPGSQPTPNGFLHYVPECTLDNYWIYEQALIKFYKNMLKDEDFVWHDFCHTHIIHDYIYWNHKSNVISTPWGVFIQRPFYRNHLVTWSRFQRGLAVQQGFPTSTRYVHGGTNTEQFSPDPDKPYEKDGYFLFCARMHPDKQPDLFLHLAEMFPSEQFVLAGSFGKHATPDHAYYGKIYAEMAQKLSNVKIERDPTKQKQIELYRRAKAVIHPSRSECFGLVIVESLATGTPVITSNEGAFPEIIIEGKTGFLASTIEQYVNAIKNVDVLSPEACRKDAETRWNRRRVAEQYKQIYEDVLKGEVF